MLQIVYKNEKELPRTCVIFGFGEEELNVCLLRILIWILDLKRTK